ncbi:hypothetical protein BV20DRAFT_974660 [Pilatotrama ljubarskyi]|nr:hypothetical protein BV20DRAFT_974660 [Pilatotrama ljubarskyi]
MRKHPSAVHLAFLAGGVVAQLSVTSPGAQDQWLVDGPSNLVSWTCETSPYTEFAIMLESWPALYGPVMLVETQKNADCSARVNVTSALLAPSLRNPGKLPLDGYSVTFSEAGTSSPDFIYAESPEFEIKAAAGATLAGSLPGQGASSSTTESTSSASGTSLQHGPSPAGPTQSSAPSSDNTGTPNEAPAQGASSSATGSTSSAAGTSVPHSPSPAPAEQRASPSGVQNSTSTPSGGPTGAVAPARGNVAKGPSTALVVALSIALPLVTIIAAALGFCMYHRYRRRRALRVQHEDRSSGALIDEEEKYEGNAATSSEENRGVKSEDVDANAEHASMHETVLHISAPPGDVSSAAALSPTRLAPLSTAAAQAAQAAKYARYSTNASTTTSNTGAEGQETTTCARDSSVDRDEDAQSTLSSAAATYGQSMTDVPVGARTEETPQRSRLHAEKENIPARSRRRRPDGAPRDRTAVQSESAPDGGPDVLSSQFDGECAEGQQPQRRFEYVTVLMEVGGGGVGAGAGDRDGGGLHEEPPPYEPRPDAR